MKRTPLHDAHVRLGARMITFADWEMPVWYAGLTAEHQSVRERVGLFDVSHMGEFVVHGPDALQNLQRLLCNDAGLLADGQVQYCSQVPGTRVAIETMTLEDLRRANVHKPCEPGCAVSCVRTVSHAMGSPLRTLGTSVEILRDFIRPRRTGQRMSTK